MTMNTHTIEWENGGEALLREPPSNVAIKRYKNQVDRNAEMALTDKRRNNLWYVAGLPPIHFLPIRFPRGEHEALVALPETVVYLANRPTQYAQLLDAIAKAGLEDIIDDLAVLPSKTGNALVLLSARGAHKLE